MATPTSPSSAGADSHRRSVTLPTSLQSAFPQPVDSSADTEDILYVHNKANVYRLGKSPSIKSSATIQSPGSSPWKTAGDTPVGFDCTLSLKSPAQSAPYLQARETRIPMMPNTQMWCVDEQSKFVTLTYRIELPFDSEQDKKSVEEFTEALKKIIQYETTPCPFKRLSETKPQQEEALGSPQRRPKRYLIGRKQAINPPTLDGAPSRRHSDLLRRFSYQSSLQSADVSEDEDDQSVGEADASIDTVADLGIRNIEGAEEGDPVASGTLNGAHDPATLGIASVAEPGKTTTGKTSEQDEDEDSSESQDESLRSQNHESGSSASDSIAAEPVHSLEKQPVPPQPTPPQALDTKASTDDPTLLQPSVLAEDPKSSKNSEDLDSDDSQASDSEQLSETKELQIVEGAPEPPEESAVDLPTDPPQPGTTKDYNQALPKPELEAQDSTTTEPDITVAEVQNPSTSTNQAESSSGLRHRSLAVQPAPTLSKSRSSSSIRKPAPEAINTGLRRVSSSSSSTSKDPNSYFLSRIVEVLTSPPSTLFGVLLDLLHRTYHGILVYSASLGGGAPGNLRLPQTPGGWRDSEETSEGDGTRSRHDSVSDDGVDSERDLDDFDVPLGNDSSARVKRANWGS